MAWIYGLIDPRTHRIRYIGRSCTPYARYRAHLTDGGGSDKGMWMTDLRQEGYLPVLVLLEEVEDNDAKARESVWIKRLQGVGSADTNGSPTQHAKRIDYYRQQREREKLNSVGGDIVKAMRQKAGLTQQNVADICGVNNTAISHWENGRRPVPEYAWRILKPILSPVNE